MIDRLKAFYCQIRKVDTLFIHNFFFYKNKRYISENHSFFQKIISYHPAKKGAIPWGDHAFLHKTKSIKLELIILYTPHLWLQR